MIEFLIGMTAQELYRMPPNHALQRTAAGRRGCNRRAARTQLQICDGVMNSAAAVAE